MLARDAYLGTLAASALISVLLAFFFWRRMPAPGSRTMIVFMAFTLAWSLGYIIEVFAVDEADFRLANNIEYIGVVGVPVVWLLFTLNYLQPGSWTARHFYLLVIIPVLTLTLVWTNPLHGLMWHDIRIEEFDAFIIQRKTYGAWFLIHSLYSYALILTGVTLVVRRLFHPARLFRLQLYTLLFSVAFPFVWNVIYVMRAAPTYYVDMTAPAFVVSGIAIAIGLFRFGILDIIPMARDRVFDRLNDGVIVFDDEDRILDMNRSAQAVTGHTLSDVIGRPAQAIWPDRPMITKFLSGTAGERTEMLIEAGGARRYFVLNRIPIYDRKRQLTGRLIILHDDTENRERSEELTFLSNRLIVVQEEERRTIARELHDEIGQRLSFIRMLLNKVLKAAPETVPGIVNEAASQVSDVLEQVRDMSLQLRPGILDDAGLAGAINWLVERVGTQSGVTTKFESPDFDVALPEQVKMSAFRIVQESLTNIMRHAGAAKAWIRLAVREGRLVIEVEDDGRGFDVTGFAWGMSTGLSSMRERAMLMHGTFTIDSSPGRGTRVIAELPFTIRVDKTGGFGDSSS